VCATEILTFDKKLNSTLSKELEIHQDK